MDQRWVLSKRPVVIVGNSLHREDAVDEARAFVAKYQLPAISSLASKGIITPLLPTTPIVIASGSKIIRGSREVGAKPEPSQRTAIQAMCM